METKPLVENSSLVFGGPATPKSLYNKAMTDRRRLNTQRTNQLTSILGYVRRTLGSIYLAQQLRIPQCILRRRYICKTRIQARDHHSLALLASLRIKHMFQDLCQRAPSDRHMHFLLARSR